MKLNLSHQRHGGSPPGVSEGKILDPSCNQTPEPTIWPSCKELQERGNPKSKWKTPKEKRNVTNLPGWTCRDVWGKFCQIQYRAVRNYKNQQQKKNNTKTTQRTDSDALCNQSFGILTSSLSVSWPAEEMWALLRSLHLNTLSEPLQSVLALEFCSSDKKYTKFFPDILSPC